MKIMPSIPGQADPEISYARSIERSSSSFCRMLSAELSAGQQTPEELQQIVSAQIRRTDIFEQLEASLKRENPATPTAEKAAQGALQNTTNAAKNNAADVARVLDFMNEPTGIRKSAGIPEDGAVRLLGDKPAIVAGVRQANNSVWDKYHMASTSRKDVGVFLGFRVSIG